MQIKRSLPVLLALAVLVGAPRAVHAQDLIDYSLLASLGLGDLNLTLSDVSSVRTTTLGSGAFVVGTIGSLPATAAAGNPFAGLLPAEVADLAVGDTVVVRFSTDVSVLGQVSIEHCLRASERTFDAPTSNALSVGLLGTTITNVGAIKVINASAGNFGGGTSPFMSCGYNTPGFSLVP